MPTVPAARLDVFIAGLTGLGLIVKFAVTVFELECLRVAEKVPAFVGLPERVPVLLSDIPDGREPEETDHVAVEGVSF